MADFYTDMQGIAADVLGEFKQGSIVLQHVVKADAAEEYNVGAETMSLFTLDGTARGVGAQHIDGKLILAGDLLVVCSVMALSQDTGEKIALDLGPTNLVDKVVIDGRRYNIRRIGRVPEAGIPVVYNIFVGK